MYDLEKMKKISDSKINFGRVLPKVGFYKDNVYIFGGSGTKWEKGSIHSWTFETGDYSHVSSSEMKLHSATTSLDYFSS